MLFVAQVETKNGVDPVDSGSLRDFQEMQKPLEDGFWLIRVIESRGF